MLINLVIVVVLVVLAGTFAGLTLALFSLTLTNLETKIKAGDKRAEKVYRIRKKGNLLLCTLLLGNVASYTIMAIFLSSITSGVVAGFIATSLIFIFGEILPQAVFPRFALSISEKLSWLVWFCLVLFYPIAAPIAFLLDRLLGKEAPVLWSKEELGEIIKYHKNVGDGIIDKDEEKIILGALSFSEKRAGNIKISIDQVFFLDPKAIIDQTIFESVKAGGFSRIPVYDVARKEIKGILYADELIGLKPGTVKVEELCETSNLIFVKENTRLDDLLNLLVQRKMHMALVLDQSGKFSGVVTLEDVMEEILKTELEDKKDQA